ncbi:hypothetical protein D3C87_1707760 [compost metagenome]
MDLVECALDQQIVVRRPDMANGQSGQDLNRGRDRLLGFDLLQYDVPHSGCAAGLPD